MSPDSIQACPPLARLKAIQIQPLMWGASTQALDSRLISQAIRARCAERRKNEWVRSPGSICLGSTDQPLAFLSAENDLAPRPEDEPSAL